MRNLSIILFLFLSGVGRVSAQEINSQNQARIWNRALVWIYEDNNKTVGKSEQKPVPQASSERLEAFEKDLAAADKNNLDGYHFYSQLYQPVQAKLSKTNPVTEKVLIRSIVAKAEKPGRKVQELQTALEQVAAGNQGSNPENSGSGVQENPQPNEAIPAISAPENVPVPTENSNQTKTAKADSNMPLYLSIAALLLATFALLRANRKSTSRSGSVARSTEISSNASGKPLPGNATVHALKKEIESLKKSVQALKKDNENWRADMQNAIQELQKTAYAAPEVSEKYDLSSNNPSPQNHPEFQPLAASELPEETENYSVDTDHLLSGENAAPQKQLKYARVPDDDQLKDKELHTDSRETWSFMEVSLPNNKSNTATFRINPYVNHALAINNSLDRLENAFEFARSANKATQIMHDADGELMRTAQGWQITRRAKIHLA